MTDKEKKTLSTEPYKGVRDFYPEDMAVENYIFGVWRATCESFGYQEYNASILEPSELYRGKTSEEIVNAQTYSFTDRGGREVTLRPEMTPTVARMIAAKRKTLSFPVRWYSIPNAFRYERPQKGRLREHFQLNPDIFGVAGIEAEVEIISLGVEILRAFGMKDSDFEIRVNCRKVMNYIILHLLGLSGEKARDVSQLIDRQAKMEKKAFEDAVSELLQEKDRLLLTLLYSQNFEEFVSHLPEDAELEKNLANIRELIASLEKLGIANVVFSQTLMRGFDYYTGIVFEAFDKNPENLRSLFGGGRYDNLLNIFGVQPIPTVGFGMGDVTMRDVLETYKLLPAVTSKTELYLCVADSSSRGFANDLAQKLRARHVAVALDLTDRKIGDQIKYADKNRIPYIAVIGDAERSGGTIKIKELATGKETALTEEEVATWMKSTK